MFFEPLQSYYAPTVTLFIFAAFIIHDQLFSNRIKKLFLLESTVILVIILATWIDRCLSVQSPASSAWKLRNCTSFMNFFLSPCSPAILVSIYRPYSWKSRLHCLLFYLPLFCSMGLCIASLKYGLVFSISPENTYLRGKLFVIPFIAAFFYMASVVFFSWNQKKKYKKEETILVMLILIAEAVATILEVIFHIRFMIWSTSEICLILYFLQLTVQKIIFEPLTGAFSRLSYNKTIEKLNGKFSCVFAMIDINNLKQINDTYGHCAGDDAIWTIAQSLMKNADKRMSLYRIGGDEFALLMKGNNPQAVIHTLRQAKIQCSRHYPPITFACGTDVYTPQQNLFEFITRTDVTMYACKKQMKRNQ
jgi:diguanylate cyclase (GGDEF)-like protein